jgi:hypothetical protein
MTLLVNSGISRGFALASRAISITFEQPAAASGGDF